MAEDKLELPAEYDPDAPPLPYDNSAEVRGRDARQLRAGLRRLRWVIARREALEKERKTLQKRLLPYMRSPVALLDPITGDPIIANAQQARPQTCDAGELLEALIDYYVGLWPGEPGSAQEHATMVWEQTLKPREVDTKDKDGLLALVASQHTDENPTIPPSVIAKVVKEKPSSAFIQFPKK